MNEVLSPNATVHERVTYYAQRGAFQGWIGHYVVYQKDGTTLGFHEDNKGLSPDYTGSEAGLYAFAGRKPFPARSRF